LLAARRTDPVEHDEIPLTSHPALTGLSVARLSMIEILAQRMEYPTGTAIYRRVNRRRQSSC